MEAVRIFDRDAARGDDEVAFPDASRIGRAVLFDAANQHPVTVRKTNGPAQMPGYVAGRNGDPEPWSDRRLASTERIVRTWIA